MDEKSLSAADGPVLTVLTVPAGPSVPSIYRQPFCEQEKFIFEEYFSIPDLKEGIFSMQLFRQLSARQEHWVYWKCTASVLSVYCQCTASVLPVYCQCTAGVLPVYCQCTASVLPVHCRCTASALGEYVNDERAPIGHLLKFSIFLQLVHTLLDLLEQNFLTEHQCRNDQISPPKNIILRGQDL